MSLTYKDISEILKIIDSSTCEELVLEVGDTKLVVRRNGAGGTSTPVSATSSAAPAGTSTESEAASPAGEPVAASTAPVATAQGTEVRAPMVGTFYRKPSPGDPPFVEEGQSVKQGDPLCLIEVMKLYTTIEAPIAGKVAGIGAQDAELVAHDQVLFVIEPS